MCLDSLPRSSDTLYLKRLLLFSTIELRLSRLPGMVVQIEPDNHGILNSGLNLRYR